MKKNNRILATVLAVTSIIFGLVVYFDKLSTLPVVMVIVVSGVISLIAMMEVFNYQDWWESNPTDFWVTVAAVSAAIIVLATFIIGLDGFMGHLWMSIAAMCCPMFVPVLGVFVGNCGRVLKMEFAVW